MEVFAKDHASLDSGIEGLKSAVSYSQEKFENGKLIIKDIR
jgi:hypothetical protein